MVLFNLIVRIETSSSSNSQNKFFLLLARKGVWQEVNAEAPYAFRGNQWVGYDNIDSVRRKAEYIKREGFGGAMLFSIDMDDFSNACCTEPFPLSRAIARVLGIRNDAQPTTGSNCSPAPPPVTPPPIAITTGFDSGMASTARPTTPWVPAGLFTLKKNIFLFI